VLQFVQKRLPLAKRLDKVGSDSIEGEREIAIETLLFGAIEKAPDRTLTDNFPAAQFLKMSQDDLLGKPSFDRLTSGLEAGQRDYQFGTAVAEVFDYEEVNLSIDKSGAGVIARPGLTLSQHRAWALELGAAGRAPQRRKQMLRPEEDVKLAVKPPPLATIDTALGTMTATALSGMAARSFFHAEDAAGGAQVVEQFEAAF